MAERAIIRWYNEIQLAKRKKIVMAANKRAVRPRPQLVPAKYIYKQEFPNISKHKVAATSVCN